MMFCSLLLRARTIGSLIMASACLFIFRSWTTNGLQGFSNPKEVPQVVKQARAAIRRYGAGADIRVITFYNMQKLALERAFKPHRDLKGIRIVSVRRGRQNFTHKIWFSWLGLHPCFQA